MFAGLEIFRMSSAMAIHAGERQAVIAQNVANADTPGYVARDISGFMDSYDAGNTFVGRATRAAHLHRFDEEKSAFELLQRPSATSPNGNSVSLETELLKAAEVKSQHDQANAIYKSALNILRQTVAK